MYNNYSSSPCKIDMNIDFLKEEDRVNGLTSIYHMGTLRFGLWELLPEYFDWDALYQDYSQSTCKILQSML